MCSIQDIEKTIVEKESQLSCALIDADVAVLDKLLDESLVFCIRGVKLTKQDYLDSKLKNLHRVYSFDVFLQIFKKITVELVELELWVELKCRFCDVDFEGKYKYVHTWKLIDGEYKLVSGSISREEENKIPV